MSKILLGVTGSIAAYKAVEITRLLKKSGLSVQVAMTETATRFIAPITFEALTGRPVLTDLFQPTRSEIEHVERAHEIDLLLIAPGTASTMARLSAGLADDVITSVALSTRAPVLIAPAMESGMWSHPATRRNAETLLGFGYHIVGPGAGDLASGRSGLGRMLEPEDVVRAAQELLGRRQQLRGKKMLITAGPTFEPIDPVRVLTNRSTGAMGIAIAHAAQQLGADVHLVLGPTHLMPPARVVTSRVETAEEMLLAAKAHFASADVFISTAAVSDFRPAHPRDAKLKRSALDARTLELVENPDILATLARARGPKQLIVGFAAETEEVEANARKKLESKPCDVVIANQVGRDRGFGVGETELLFVTRESTVSLGIGDKAKLAGRLVEALAARIT